MLLTILNTKFEIVYTVDSFSSIIWAERYSQYGDFELYFPISEQTYEIFRRGYYILREDSDRAMIIEDTETTFDPENGNYISVKGKSLESILERRIIWGEKTYSGNFEDQIHQILDDCIINPTNSDRKIPNFIFENMKNSDGTDDLYAQGLTLDIQCTGKNLYEVIVDACKNYGLGFQITLRNQSQFVFSLLHGTDRSYFQNRNPWIIFSPDFDNLLNSRYTEESSNAKNVALVSTEVNDELIFVSVGNAFGLSRKEIYVEASDVNDEDGSMLLSLLEQRGQETLATKVNRSIFEGEADTSRSFIIEKDFYLGDIIQVSNGFGQDDAARVTEIIFNEDESGFYIRPTFEKLSDNFFVSYNILDSDNDEILDSDGNPIQSRLTWE